MKMRIVRYICDKCGKEIKGQIYGIAVHLLDPDNTELVLDSTYDDIENTPDRQYCDKCIKRILYFANHSAATDNQEFAEAMQKMVKEPSGRDTERMKERRRGKMDWAKAQELLAAGVPVKEIAEQLGVTKDAVYRQIRAHRSDPVPEQKVLEKQDAVSCTEEIMQKCVYGGKFGGVIACDYLGITGKRRPCSPDECTKYVEKSH